ncbi:MAG: metallophosphoesterase family protein, partial [Deltaproteobacteria bacterium]|nr:metallophosphoesterase family protein [Deltaproteobacteria bacterium]
MEKFFTILFFFIAFESNFAAQVFPYLQSPSPSSIYICWQTTEDLESTLFYGNTPSMGNTIVGETEVLANRTIWHVVKLDNLTANTVYYYQIKTAEAESDVYHFKTPPPFGSHEGHVRFGVLGDSRTVPTMYRQVIKAMKEKMIELYGEDIENNINVILNVGDIITTGGTLDQYQREYFDPITPLSGTVPFMVSIGNHENEDPFYYQYMKYEDFGGAEGEKYYSFQIGRVLFIGINSNWQLRNDTQISWLNNVLQAAQANNSIDWIFAYCHHPGHSEVWPDGNTGYIQDRVIPTLSKYSKAAFLMYGHSHNYERGAIRDLPLRLMLNGGGGAGLDRWRRYGNQRDYPEIQKSFDHYCYSIFDIDLANKNYVVQTFSLGTPDKRLNNVKIDSFYRKLENFTPPEKPEAIAVNDSVKLPFTLKASNYSGSEPILSSHFQLTTSSADYNEPLVDSKRDFENIYLDTGPPDYQPIDKNAGINL